MRLANFSKGLVKTSVRPSVRPCQNFLTFLHMISAWYNLKKGFRIWFQEKTKNVLFYMHWENKFSLFLKYFPNTFSIYIKHSSCAKNNNKKKWDSYKSTHKFVLKEVLWHSKNFLIFYFRCTVEIRSYKHLIIKVNSLNVTENISLELKNMNFHWQQWVLLPYLNIF